MSVRAMSLPRPATPLHDRPAPRRWVQIDPILLIVTVLLIGYGLVMTYSTTAETRTFTGDPMQFVIRGAVWAAVGMAAMAAVALFDYAWLGAFAPLLYVFTLGLLSVVLAIGTSSLGAQRSVNIGGLSFQFSEVAKVLMIIVLAKFFADRRASIGSPLTMLLGLALLAPAVLLVYRQPDLGTSLVFIAIFFGIAFLAGARIWQLVALVAIAAHPVTHRGRLGRRDWQRPHRRYAVAARLPTDRRIRFRVLRPGRGSRIRRRGDSFCALHRPARRRASRGASCEGPLRDADRRWGGDDAALSDLGERRDGDLSHAGDWDPASLHLARRQLARLDLLRTRRLAIDLDAARARRPLVRILFSERPRTGAVRAFPRPREPAAGVSRCRGSAELAREPRERTVGR